MSARFDAVRPAVNLVLAKARARLLARSDRQLKMDLVAQRRRAGMTQKQVAELLGISQQAITKLERYDSDPKLSSLRRYANAVGAIVEHRVTPDRGQSARLAASSRWEPSRWEAVVPVRRPVPLLVTFADHRDEVAATWRGESATVLQVQG
jgi:transcriptional regulator with XRE-family HTH domain